MVNTVKAHGANPGVEIRAGVLEHLGPTDSRFPGQGSDLDSLACKAGVLPIRRPGSDH
jgi:hypothetical protein